MAGAVVEVQRSEADKHGVLVRIDLGKEAAHVLDHRRGIDLIAKRVGKSTWHRARREHLDRQAVLAPIVVDEVLHELRRDLAEGYEADPPSGTRAGTRGLNGGLRLEAGGKPLTGANSLRELQVAPGADGNRRGWGADRAVSGPELLP